MATTPDTDLINWGKSSSEILCSAKPQRVELKGIGEIVYKCPFIQGGGGMEARVSAWLLSENCMKSIWVTYNG